MHADAALSEPLRSRLLPDSRLKGQANLLVMPNVEAANIAHNLLRALGGGVSIGPIVIGAARAAHVVTQTITVRGIVNMTALAVLAGGGGVRAEVEEGTPVTRQITGTLELCEAQGTWSKGRMKQLGGIAGEVLDIYRGKQADPNLLYRMI